MILANTSELHEHIAALCARVRQLEDALHDAHGQLSRDQHPLLTDELLQVKRPLEREPQADVQKDADAEAAEAIDAVGSLCVARIYRHLIARTLNSTRPQLYNGIWPYEIFRHDRERLGASAFSPRRVTDHPDPAPLPASCCFRYRLPCPRESCLTASIRTRRGPMTTKTARK